MFSVSVVTQELNKCHANFNNTDISFSFYDRARVLIYILKDQLFALKYTLIHSFIKINLLAFLHVSVLSDHPQGFVMPSC